LNPKDGPNEGGGDKNEEFKQRLASLIYDALADGVAVEGAWDITSEANDREDPPDLTIEIYEVEG